ETKKSLAKLKAYHFQICQLKELQKNMHGLNMMIEKPTPPIFDDTGDGIGAYKKLEYIIEVNEKDTHQIQNNGENCTSDPNG
ncbi:10296_t:CDS:2, partial [Entrophospora sp. SA101]